MNKFLLLILLFCFSAAYGQQVDSGDFRLEQLPVNVTNQWKFHAGDNPAWADPAFDDHNWQHIDATQEYHFLPRVAKAQIGWFRLTLDVSPTLRKKTVAMVVNQYGAAEVYFNGVLIRTMGRVSNHYDEERTRYSVAEPLTLQLTNAAKQYIAIRYSFNSSNLVIGYGPPVIRTSFSQVDSAWDNFFLQVDFYTTRAWVSGGFMLLWLLQLAIYLFNRERKVNLYLSLYALMQMITLADGLLTPMVHSSNWYNIDLATFNVAAPLDFVFLMMMTYAFFGYKRGRWFMIVVLLSLPVMILQFIADNAANEQVLAIGNGIIYATIIGVSIKAIREKKTGAMLFLTGIVISLIFFTLFNVGGISQPFLAECFEVALAFITPAIILSILLAREFAQNIVSLRLKLAEVESLSARSLQQEVEKQQILARQNETLEQKVTERTAELRHSLDELELEAALDRVRARTIAMQKSEELHEVIQLVFEQLQQLNFNIDVANFALNYNETDDFDLLLAVPHGTYAMKIHVPYTKHPIFDRFNKAKKKGGLLIDTFTKHEKDSFFEHFFKYVPGVPEETKASIFNRPGFVRSSVLMKNTALTIHNYDGISYSETENNTLLRFGQVFEQTYTRFLDLQRAEIQGREAVKQASVDRVRAEVASMRSTKDLERIIPLIWDELTILNVPFIRCGVFIVDEDEKVIHTHLSTPDGKALAVFNLPFAAEGIAQSVLPAWRKKQIAVLHWSAGEFAANTKTLVSQGAIKSKGKYVTGRPDTTLDLHFLPFLQGMLYVGNTAPLTDDEIDLVQSLAEAFSTAYARYEDFNKLEAAKQQMEKTLTELKAAQTQLIQTEKMASLGELTAGIAHEIQNPLNFVNNFSEVSVELLVELKEEEEKGNKEDVIAIADDLTQNLEKIRHHGKRADAIVKGMLEHSRSNSGQKEPTDLNAMAEEYMRLSYHGLRAKDKSFNAEMITHFDPSLPKINVLQQDMGRVMLNLFNNAFYAVNQKSKMEGADYKPEVSVATSMENGQVVIKVKDNGIGIPDAIKEKIMQPFFTTKPTGEGTGLGLSLTHDMVVKGHGGSIEVNTKEGVYTEFKIALPIS